MAQIDRILEITGLNLEKRAQMARYYASMPDDDRIEAHRLQGDLIRQYRSEWKGKIDADFFYGLLCLALWKMQWTREALSKKSALTAEEAEKITQRRLSSFKSIQIERKRKASRKANIIDLKLYHVVTKLRSEGLSWRQVSEYLAKYHKTNISHAYLRDVYTRKTTEREQRGQK